MDLQLPGHGRHRGRAQARGRRADGRDPHGRSELAAVRRRRVGPRGRIRRLPREAAQCSRAFRIRCVATAPGTGRDSVLVVLPRPLGIPVRGTRYPVVLPSVRDPRLHLAARDRLAAGPRTGRLRLRLSIAQILISVGTCAVLELAIVFRRQRVLVWPASALLTGNGVAFILRVPGTEHGDWWSLHGAWIYATTAAVAPALEVCHPVPRPARLQPVEPRARPLLPRARARSCGPARLLVGADVGVPRARAGDHRRRRGHHPLAPAAARDGGLVLARVRRRGRRGRRDGHAMTAKWHLGPIDGLRFWTVLATSPEILVFLFFMLTDPKTVPAGRRARIVFAVSVALLAALLLASAQTEFWAKVSVLGALVIACAARPALEALAPSMRPRRVVALAAAAAVAYVGALVAGGLGARPAPARRHGLGGRADLPRIAIAPSRGVDAKARPDDRHADRLRPATARPAGHRCAACDRVARGEVRPGADRGRTPGGRACRDRRGAAVAERLQRRPDPAVTGCQHRGTAGAPPLAMAARAVLSSADRRLDAAAPHVNIVT